jgi:betaine-aldehyde dehydrogenase
MRQRFFPFSAGARHGWPDRVRAPQGGLASIGPVLRRWCFGSSAIFGPSLSQAAFQCWLPPTAIPVRSSRHQRIQLRSECGLTAAIVTNDLAKAMKTAERVEAGYVWINSSGRYVGAPYGGWKQNGIGEEECFDEILSYTQIKNLNMRW